MQNIEPSATIVKANGEIFELLFVCVDCNRVSIFTNEFIEDAENHMQCPNCFGFSFRVKGALRDQSVTMYYVMPE